jgi:peptidoglycan/LPS O-acetylase OafA/YrhL
MTTSPSDFAARDRIDALDVLRGLAALWVFLYHLWNLLYPDHTTQYEAARLTGRESWAYLVSFFTLQYGYFGVTIFFVVSGFCIHLPQARRHAKTGRDEMRLGTFFRRRFWRLYPAYFMCLLVASLGYGTMLWTDHFFRTGTTSPPAGLAQVFGLEWIPVSALFLQPFVPAANSLNGPLWTLVLEVQFYLCYPLLLWLTRRLGMGVVGAVLLACEVVFLDHPAWKDQVLLGRYFEWYLGFLAAEWFVRRRLQGIWPSAGFWCSLGLGLVMLTTFVGWLHPYGDLAMALTTVVGISVLMNPSRAPTSASPRFVFLWKSLLGVGAFSYSLYLLHIPLLRLVYAGNRFLALGLGLPESWVPWMILDSIPIILLAAQGFSWCFERPFLKSGKFSAGNLSLAETSAKTEPRAEPGSSEHGCQTGAVDQLPLHS